MKKTKFFMPLIAALALSSCSSDEPAAVNGGNEDLSDARFLAVSIVSNGDISSRAGDQYGENIKFEDGEGDENTVNNVRIYFFSAGGDAVAVKKNSSVNYYDVPVNDIKTNTDPSENHGETVEQILEAVVVVEAGDKLPAQLLAVINPDTSNTGLGIKSLSLSELTEKVNDYALLANGTSKTFVMTNSVYPDNNQVINTTRVSPANYATSEAEAKKDENVVKIYVERNVAKVRLSATKLDKEGDLYKVYKKGSKGDGTDDTEYKIGEGDNAKQVYLKLEGWGVTADLKHEYLSKHIKYSWGETYLGANTTWFSVVNHRSYWADVCNPTGKENYNQYYEYNALGRLTKNKFDGTEYVYCNENAERPAGLNLEPTMVLIKGTLCDKDGKALYIDEYGGNRVIDDENLTTLKNRYILMYTASKEQLPYKKVEEVGGKITYKQMSAEDLTFIPIEKVAANNVPDADATDEAKAATNVASGRYKVYATLTDEAKVAEWYSDVKITTNDKGEEVTTVNVNSKLANTKGIEEKLLGLSYAKVWKSGMTYYYANIKHIGIKEGTVRNHIYDLDLTKIYGIGTPVYDEKLTIIPEKPQNDQTYIAAQVNILSWRIVPSSLTLDWD